MAKDYTHLVHALLAMSDGMLSDIGDHHTGRQLKAEVNRLQTGVAALNAVNMSRSPLDTEAAHALKVAKMARKLDTEITATLNRAAEHWGAGMKDAQRRIDEKISLTPDAFAGEIRNAFRGLTNKAKAELINNLVDQNRGPELAAIVKAPPVLTGISEDQRAAYEKAIVAKHASDELDELANMESVFGVVVAATSASGSFVRDLTNPHRIAEIERGDDAATAAGEAFNQSLQ